MQQEQSIKIVLIGAAGVGKSSILKRYTTNEFDTREQPTLGASFHAKIIKIKGQSYKLHIWDTAGQEKYAPLAIMYYRDAHAILLVYDVSKKDSFEILKSWYEEIREKGPNDVILAVIGNKSDLVEQEEIEVEKAKEYASYIGIKELFDKVIEKVVDNKLAADGVSCHYKPSYHYKARDHLHRGNLR